MLHIVVVLVVFAIVVGMLILVAVVVVPVFVGTLGGPHLAAATSRLCCYCV